MSAHILDNYLGNVWLPNLCLVQRLRSPLVGGLAAASVYLSLVQFLRFRRVRKLERKYGKAPHILEKTTGNVRIIIGRPDVKLTPEEAQEIMFVTTKYDMPGLMSFSLIFALFKTYSIPSISEILLKSQQLSAPENVARRYVDTGILISTWMSCPFIDPSKVDITKEEVDPRGAIAIARVNWLHSRWPMIKKDDYLYTLALFILEPARWAKAFGWREMLPIEQEAYFVYWKEIGGRMDIKDIPETLEALCEWAESYEELNMMPAESNYEVGMHTLNTLVRTITERFGLRDFFRNVLISLLDDRARDAFMLSKPSAFVRRCALFLVSYFAVRHRYFSLPRFTPDMYTMVDVPAKELKEEMPRLHPSRFGKEPWYKSEPTGLSWFMQVIMVKIGICEEEYVPSVKYKCAGCRLEEIGPIALENSGHAEVMSIAAKIQGCPVSGVWARKGP
ncbi:hypothetical protein M0805_003942 [Coniferiporia weirii]|nr:hypothetical protein M0805_003942 [Coniferiporia weirii]